MMQRDPLLLPERWLRRLRGVVFCGCLCCCMQKTGEIATFVPLVGHGGAQLLETNFA